MQEDLEQFFVEQLSTTKVGLGKGFSAVTRIARALRELDLEGLVATSSRVIHP
jgi:hypothetical protein